MGNVTAVRFEEKPLSEEWAVFQEGKNASEEPPCFTSRPPLFVFVFVCDQTGETMSGDEKFDSTVSGEWLLSDWCGRERKNSFFFNSSQSAAPC